MGNDAGERFTEDDFRGIANDLERKGALESADGFNLWILYIILGETSKANAIAGRAQNLAFFINKESILKQAVDNLEQRAEEIDRILGGADE